MNVHKNARLTPSGRLVLVSRVKSGWTVLRASEAAGVSRRTAHRWLRRYLGGDRGLCDGSSAPRRCPHRVAEELVREVERMRRQRLSGPAIARRLGMANSTVGLILGRLGLNRLSRLEPRPPVVRYERDRPGEMIHIDIKKLGRFEVVGHRITGDRQAGRSRRIGWDFLHVAIDDASRASEGQFDATGFLERALGWFGRPGIRVERVMTDKARPTARSASPRRSPPPASPTSAPGPIPPEPTARPSASSRPR